MLQKRLPSLMAALAVAVILAMPALAHATPQFQINGNLAAAAHQHVVQYGTLTLTSQLGEFKCKVLAGMAAWNEGGNGFASVEAWQPDVCSASECPGEAFVTPEYEVELNEKINTKSEKEFTAKRGYTSLPWPAETLTEEGRTRLNIRRMRLSLVCPAQAIEVPFSGNLEPLIVNGLKNGLSPSHLRFEGKGGKTSWLDAPCNTCAGGEPDRLYLSGELTTIGTSEELVTAE